MITRSPFIAIGLAVLTAVALQGCIRPHKAPVTQGNLVSQKDFDQLKLGMTHEQVEFLIGKPIVDNPFGDNANWEYVYVAYLGYQKPVKKKMVLHFNNDTLASIDGSIVYEDEAVKTQESTDAPVPGDNDSGDGDE